MRKHHSLSKSERIKRSSEYRRIWNKGTSYRDGVFILAILKNDIGCHRLGLSISSSKIPLASRRNRLKRLIRETFRLNKVKLKNGSYDVVISVAKALPRGINYTMVEGKLLKLLRKADAL